MTRRRVRPVVLAATLGTALAFAPAAALADGDPASDVLYGSTAYYPYQPALPSKYRAQVNKLLAQAQAQGNPIRVAVIASQVDLGALPELFGKPQPYATFLDREIQAYYRGDLLVVMPNGFGVAGPHAAAGQQALQGAPTPSAAAEPLAKATLDGVQRLAKAGGHPLGAPGGGGPGSGHGGGGWIVIVIVAGAILAIAGALGARRAGRRPSAQ